MPQLIKKIGFTILACLSLLGLIEIGLRTTMPDLEEVVSPLLYQRNSGQSYTSGRAPETRVYVSGRRRTVLDKKPGIRVLVFGASAAYGEMFSPFTAFPGQAETIIQRTNPDIPVEILNLAHGGMGSRQVGEMAFRALENDQPDLIVIYTGNNEYHEIRALKARSERYDPGAELLRRRLSQSFLYRKIRDVLHPNNNILAPPKEGTWLPIGRLDVTVDNDDRALGLALYRDHLRSILLAAKEHGVPVMLATVATNVRDHLDNATPGTPSQLEHEVLHKLQEQVDKTSKKQFATTVRANLIDITTEGGLHRLGQLLLRAELPEIAADVFERKELAALRPMTSNRAMRSIVHQLGGTHSVKVCDLAGTLAASTADGIPGNDVFIDHCHPNAVGHKVLGEALADCILNLGIGGLRHPTKKIEKESFSPLRLDQYNGHRHIPGYKSNPQDPDISTQQGMAILGHQAFVEERFDDALAAYKAALTIEKYSAHIEHSIGLTQMYRDDLDASRAAFKNAADAGLTASKLTHKTIAK